MIGGENILQKSTNFGLNWQTIAKGLGKQIIYGDGKGTLIRVTNLNSQNTAIISTNNGSQWKSIPITLERDEQVTVIRKKDSNIFISYRKGNDDGGLWKSTDLGKTWKKCGIGTIKSFIQDVTFDAYGNVYFMTAHWKQNNQTGIFKSTDLGETWNNVNFPQNVNSMSLGQIFFTKQNILFLTGSHGSVFLKKENDYNWYQPDSPFDFFGSFYENENGLLFLGTQAIGMLDGVLWVQIKTPFPEYANLGVNNLGDIYALGEGKLYKSKLKINEVKINSPQDVKGYFNWNYNTGDHHVRLEWNYTPTNEEGFMIFRNRKDRGVFYQFVCTANINETIFHYYGHDLLDTDTYAVVAYNNEFVSQPSLVESLILSGIKQNPDSLPIEFSLYQNYPNPFNPATTIKYSIPHLQFVVLKVYDVLGREIKTLVSEQKLPGNYEIVFDGSNLTSGVYFYQLNAGGFKATKKFIIAK